MVACVLAVVAESVVAYAVFAVVAVFSAGGVLAAVVGAVLDSATGA